MKRILRTELLTRPSFITEEGEEFSWQKNLTAFEKKNLLNSLVKNYQRFKKITDKSIENNKQFMPEIKRGIFSAKNYPNLIRQNIHNNQKNFKEEERAKTCAVYEKGEERIRKIFAEKNNRVFPEKEEKNRPQTYIDKEKEV